VTSAPQVPIHWTLDYKHLRVGTMYVVAKAFRDFDRVERKVGDGFLYLGHNYFPYESGLTLYVASPSGAFDTWRLQCNSDEQGAVDEALADHLVPGAVVIDQGAFMHALAQRIGDENKLSRALGLELVARMPSVTPQVAGAVVAHLTRDVDLDEAVTLLMALYNVAGANERARIEALRDRLSGDARTIGDAVLRKLDRL
jgi:hypothetical protein